MYFKKRRLFKSLKARAQDKVFADLAAQEKQELIDLFSDVEVSELLENIPADEAMDLSMTLVKEQAFRWVRHRETEKSK